MLKLSLFFDSSALILLDCFWFIIVIDIMEILFIYRRFEIMSVDMVHISSYMHEAVDDDDDDDDDDFSYITVACATVLACRPLRLGGPWVVVTDNY